MLCRPDQENGSDGGLRSRFRGTSSLNHHVCLIHESTDSIFPTAGSPSSPQTAVAAGTWSFCVIISLPGAFSDHARLVLAGEFHAMEANIALARASKHRG